MMPIRFPEANTVYAKEQPQYEPLPAYTDPSGIVVSCWRLTIRERLTMLLTGRLWAMVMTFKTPLQPLALIAKSPFKDVTP